MANAPKLLSVVRCVARKDLSMNMRASTSLSKPAGGVTEVMIHPRDKARTREFQALR